MDFGNILFFIIEIFDCFFSFLLLFDEIVLISLFEDGIFGNSSSLLFKF